MRAIAVISIVFLSCMEIQAQDQLKKGVYSLAGSISYYSGTFKQVNNETNESNISLMPSASYFIFDQVELSLDAGYSHTSTTGSFDMNNTSLDLGMGLRYYFPCGNFAPFIGADGQMNWYTREGQSYSSPYTYYTLTGGLEIFIAESAAIEPAIRYSKSNSPYQFSSSMFSLGVGVKYFIP